MLITVADLDDFIARSDALGGPETPQCQTFWQGFAYQPRVTIDQSLDPRGDEYVAQQFALYEELAGHAYNSASDEHVPMDVDHHVTAINPYDHPSPAGLALHLERLARALRLAAPPRGGQVLDMGCGWGLSSEIAAYTGCEVTAVDINTDFVSLVNRRAERTRLPITAKQSPFETFSTERRFDVIMFYECLHHAVRPWEIVRNMRRLLAPEGKIVLVGEPINAIWWRAWGLRLDALSVYCIRKFGWFESGWSQAFILELLAQEGLSASVTTHADAEIGTIIVAAKGGSWELKAAEIAATWQHAGWSLDGSQLAALANSTLSAPFPEGSSGVRLAVRNFRGKPIALRITGEGLDRHVTVDAPGTIIDLERSGNVLALRFESESWCPADELGNGDHRLIGVHLEGATFT